MAVTKYQEKQQQKATQIEIYGFAGWIASMMTYGCFILWAYLPDSVLHSYGITYYASKYWCIAIPAFCCVLFVFSSIFYVAINLMSTAPLNSIETIADSHSKEYLYEELDGEDHTRIPQIMDAPLTLTNRIMQDINST